VNSLKALRRWMLASVIRNQEDLRFSSDTILEGTRRMEWFAYRLDQMEAGMYLWMEIKALNLETPRILLDESGIDASHVEGTSKSLLDTNQGITVDVK
jgi:hypothetical protein